MIAYLSSLLLLELGTNFPQSQPLVKDCQFGVSPVNYSDSDSDERSEYLSLSIDNLWFIDDWPIKDNRQSDIWCI